MKSISSVKVPANKPNTDKNKATCLPSHEIGQSKCNSHHSTEDYDVKIYSFLESNLTEIQSGTNKFRNNNPSFINSFK